jgi:hypothetical protein
MAITITHPKFSFVRLNETEDFDGCLVDGISYCLPVAKEDDVWFQFVAVAETAEEANQLCDAEDDLVTVGLINGDDDCLDDFVVNFKTAGYKPERIRLSETQVLYNWKHGFPDYDDTYAVGDCFKIKIKIVTEDGDIVACSNCFERVTEDCYTSVVDYGSEQNIFDFNYCGSGNLVEVEEGAECVEPQIISFENETALDIPYTAAMQDKYGTVPSVELWVFDEDTNEYVEAVVRVGFDAYPPTRILADLGGTATGFLKISK